MRPEDNVPSVPSHIPPSRPSGLVVGSRDSGNEAAANVARSQIDALYGPGTIHLPPTDTPQNISTTPASHGSNQPVNVQVANQSKEVTDPYERTHDESVHHLEDNVWQRYHSAWQSYYQQYYERYYVGQVHAAKQSLEEQFTQHVTADQAVSPDEALYDLRSKLRSRITSRAAEIKKSRHFIPAVAAMVVMLIFLFLQYNRILFANVEAYVSPGALSQSSIIVDSQTAVGPDPKLIIPTISIEVPIIWDAVASDQQSLNAAMDNGVAWFNIVGADAHPGEFGNFVVSGHSANDWVDKGNYKFIFSRLDQLKEGDTVYANYNGTRYTYSITGKKVVKPTDVSVLQVGSDKPRITLITCTPLGTDWDRLLVFGEQVSPDPATAAKAPASTDSSKATKMPSNSPTFLQRIFGINP